jgi:uncharacterized membrane protein YfcA
VFEQLVLLLVSLVANTFSAFSGGGAGLLQFPLLIFLGLPFGIALATHKVASVALGVGAMLRHARERTLARRLSLEMLLFGLPGVVLGANIILGVPERIAEVALGCLTIGLGMYSFLKKQLGVEAQPRASSLSTTLVGGTGLFFIGILNGSLTSGTGLFVTIWLILWYGLDYKRAVAYTLVWVGLFWNGAGALTLGLIGEIKWTWLPALLVGSLVGGYLGSHLAIEKGSRWIKRAFEVVTLCTGLALLLK